MRRASWDVHARVTDMDLDGVYASVNFPSALVGFCRPPAPAGDQRPRAGAGGDAGVQRLAPRSVGRRLPGPLHPVPGAVAARPRDRGRRRSARNAAAGFKAISFTETPEPARPAVDPHRLLGPAPRSLRGDRDGRCACTSGRRRDPDDVERRAGRRHRRALLRRSPCSRRSTGSTRKIPVRFPDIKIVPVRRRHRLGGRAARPPRPRRQVPGRSTARWEGIEPHARARSCSATSGSARSTTLDASTCVDRIGVEHITRRDRLPAPRRQLARLAGDPLAPDRPPPARRRRHDRVAQRVGAVPPPGAGLGRRRSRELVIRGR